MRVGKYFKFVGHRCRNKRFPAGGKESTVNGLPSIVFGNKCRELVVSTGSGLSAAAELSDVPNLQSTIQACRCKQVTVGMETEIKSS